MQYTIVAFFILALYSCSADTSQAENVIRDENTSTTLKGKRLQIKDSTGIDLRFSFAESYPTEEGTVYQVVSHYDNKNIGFDLIIHNEGDLKLTIKSTGDNSDNFLHVLQTLYNLPADTALKFTEAITADCLPLSGYMDRINRKANGNATSVIEKKLFFQGRKKDEYAEFYLAINEQKHWIELKEADQTYRPAFIKLLTQKPKRQYRKTRKAGTRELAPGKV
jgi:hypothetical protein